MIMFPNCINKGQLREWLEHAVTNKLPGIWLDGSHWNIMRLAKSLRDSRCWLRGVHGWLGQLMTGDHHHQLNELSSPRCLRGPSGEPFTRYELRPFASTPLLEALMHFTVLVLHLNSSICRFPISVWVLILSFIPQSYILHPPPAPFDFPPLLWIASATYSMFLCCFRELLITVTKLIFVFSVVVISKRTHWFPFFFFFNVSHTLMFRIVNQI